MIKHKASIEGRARLDSFLADLYPAISRSFLQKLCNSDQVLVNDTPQKSGYKLHDEDDITILYDMEAIGVIEDIDLPIVFQDDNIIVINKPPGVISHARGRYWNEPSVASFVRQITGQDGERAGIVHRLDRATSGIMVCAKNQKTLAYLQKQFADRKVIKTYIAVIEGHMQPISAIIDMPIERNPKLPSTFRVGPNGKPAQTEYKVLKSSTNYELLELLPKTGRTHQLRVHLKHSGNPIIGDVLYGGKVKERLYLHAYSIELNLPGNINTTFSTPIPSEFEDLLKNDS